MKVVAISDLHGTLPDVPACDLLIVAGDICPVWDHSLDFQALWLDTNFRAWLERVPAKTTVGIGGNHDWLLQVQPKLIPPGLPWIYLQDSGTVVDGIRIWGSPWQPRFHSWAFNGDPDWLENRWSKIPENTDILVTHGPPRGVGDRAPRPGGGFEDCGCPHLLRRIEEVRPKVCVYGHIHCGRGHWQIGGIDFYNAAILDDQYRHVHEPWVFDYETQANQGPDHHPEQRPKLPQQRQRQLEGAGEAHPPQRGQAASTVTEERHGATHER